MSAGWLTLFIATISGGVKGGVKKKKVPWFLFCL